MILIAVVLEVVILKHISSVREERLQEETLRQATVEKPAYRVITMQVTAYCPCKKCCGKRARGLTSTGKNANQSGAAADPRLLPYGTILEIPGVGFRKVDDTGGKMRQDAERGIYHIDIRFWGPKAHKRARTFGVQELLVKVWFPQ